jgi:hypothetical protein
LRELIIKIFEAKMECEKGKVIEKNWGLLIVRRGFIAIGPSTAALHVSFFLLSELP